MIGSVVKLIFFGRGEIDPDDLDRALDALALTRGGVTKQG